MISSTLGAPLGGWIRAGQYGFDPTVVRSILPPNFCGGAGIWSPWIVIVALGEPGVPVTSWAATLRAMAASTAASATNINTRHVFIRFACISNPSSLLDQRDLPRHLVAHHRVELVLDL